jgi:hypothetical protein
VRVVKARSTAEQDESDERDRELRSLKQQHSQQVQGLQQIIHSQRSHLAEKDQTIAQKDETIAELREQKGAVVEEKERELRQKVDENNQLERRLGRVKQQLEESERVNAQFQRRIAELEQLRPAIVTSSSSNEQRTSIKLTWREGERAPHAMSGSYNAAVDGSTLYVMFLHQTFCYTISTSSWSQLPDRPTVSCPSVIINNLLTLVGGRVRGARTITNQLFSLTGEGSGRRWTEEFPPMPTKRYVAIVLSIEVALIVGGGENYESKLQTVEVLNTKTFQWSTAADLPQPLKFAPAAACGDQVYILGEPIMYTCSLQALVQTRNKSFFPNFRNRSARVWKEVTAPPVTETTCVSIHGRLLAIGGRDPNYKPTSAVHMYNPTTDSWEVISHMGTPRYNCIAAFIPNNQLMVIGGLNSGTANDSTMHSIEFASIE